MNIVATVIFLVGISVLNFLGTDSSWGKDVSDDAHWTAVVVIAGVVVYFGFVDAVAVGGGVAAGDGVVLALDD